MPDRGASQERDVREIIEGIRQIVTAVRKGPRHGVTEREAMLYDKGYDDALRHVESQLTNPSVAGVSQERRQR